MCSRFLITYPGNQIIANLANYAYQKSLDISSSLNNNTAYVKTKVSMLSLYVDIKKFDKALQLGNELVDYVKEKIEND